MKTLAFISQKGGSGKTTLTVHCAVAALESGEHVAIADTDTQGSALVWASARGTDRPPEVLKASAGNVAALSQARTRGLLIVDSAPHTAPEAARLAQVATLVAIPCRPTAFDLAAVTSTVEIVRAASTRAVFILSACPHRAPEIEEARAVLSEFGFPVFPGQITERRPFARAVATGRAVTEFDTHGKAADEVRALWTWLFEELRNGKGK